MLGILSNENHGLLEKVTRKLAASGLEVAFIDANNLDFYFSSGGTFKSSIEDYKLIWLDRVVENGDALHGQLDLLEVCMERGVKFFNNPKSYRKAYNKATTTALLSNIQVPVVDTVVTHNLQSALDFLRKWNTCIVKESLSFSGKGCRIIKQDDVEQSKSVLQAMMNNGHLIYMQPYIKSLDYRRDMKIYMVGKEVANACIYEPARRLSYWIGDQDDIPDHIDPPAECKEMAATVMSEFGLDFAGIDLVRDTSGNWFISEINPEVLSSFDETVSMLSCALTEAYQRASDIP